MARSRTRRFGGFLLVLIALAVAAAVVLLAALALFLWARMRPLAAYAAAGRRDAAMTHSPVTRAGR